MPFHEAIDKSHKNKLLTHSACLMGFTLQSDFGKLRTKGSQFSESFTDGKA